MCINIQDDIAYIQKRKLLDLILKDKTTKRNILWGTDAYDETGPDFARDREILPDLITGKFQGIIAIRAAKAAGMQSARTRQHAEVFTPLWIVKKMNDYADETWFGRESVFDTEDAIVFPKRKTWKHYVDSRRLEITCGEAPYLVSRYDAADGKPVPIGERIGILDRKLRIVNENASDETEWKKWALRAFQATYGYEFQGDNLLIARINLLMTYRDYMVDRWGHEPDQKDFKTVLNVIVWNVWQMDGLTGRIPYCRANEEYIQVSTDDMLEMMDTGKTLEEIYRERQIGTQMICRIFDWREKASLEFRDLKKNRE